MITTINEFKNNIINEAKVDEHYVVFRRDDIIYETKDLADAKKFAKAQPKPTRLTDSIAIYKKVFEITRAMNENNEYDVFEQSDINYEDAIKKLDSNFKRVDSSTADWGGIVAWTVKEDDEDFFLGYFIVDTTEQHTEPSFTLLKRDFDTSNEEFIDTDILVCHTNPEERGGLKTECTIDELIDKAKSL